MAKMASPCFLHPFEGPVPSVPSCSDHGGVTKGHVPPKEISHEFIYGARSMVHP